MADKDACDAVERTRGFWVDRVERVYAFALREDANRGNDDAMLSHTLRSGVLFVAAGFCALGWRGLAAPAGKEPVKWNNPPAAPVAGIEHHSFQSAAIGTEVGYSVALPPDYATSGRRYPVIYFLHGSGGTESSDAAGFSGLVVAQAKRGEIPEVICVFPNGGLTGYRDNPATGLRAETMIVGELIPLVDQTYRTDPRRESRVIAGFSMGGAGAICLALKHPDLFSAAAAWAAAFDMPETGTAPGEELGVGHLRAIAGRVRLLMIVGSEDMTYPGHAPVLQNLHEVHYPFDLRVLGGVDHNLGEYYRRTGDELAKFVTAGFGKAHETHQ